MEESQNGASEAAGDRSAGAVQPASIVPYKDGPYIVRGSFRILAQDGTDIDPGRRTVALCRCGKSRVRPFCDGTHRLAGFRAPGTPDDGAAPARAPAVRRLAPEPSRSSCALPAAAIAPGQGGEQFSVLLTSVHAAHAALAVALEQACSAEDYLAMRLAEPLVRAAWALIETRALHAPAPFPPGQPIGGRPVACALIGAAMGAIGEMCERGADPLLETAGALLGDAVAELDVPEGRL